MNPFPLIDFLLSAILAVSCGIAVQHFRAKQQQRRVRRITDRVIFGTQQK